MLTSKEVKIIAELQRRHDQLWDMDRKIIAKMNDELAMAKEIIQELINRNGSVGTGCLNMGREWLRNLNKINDEKVF